MDGGENEARQRFSLSLTSYGRQGPIMGMKSIWRNKRGPPSAGPCKAGTAEKGMCTPKRLSWERSLEVKANTEINTHAWILSEGSYSETRPKSFGKYTFHSTQFTGAGSR